MLFPELPALHIQIRLNLNVPGSNRCHIVAALDIREPSKNIFTYGYKLIVIDDTSLHSRAHVRDVAFPNTTIELFTMSRRFL
jgi:hypothetical protein